MKMTHAKVAFKFIMSISNAEQSGFDRFSCVCNYKGTLKSSTFKCFIQRF